MMLEQIKQIPEGLYDDVKSCDINTNTQLRELLYRFVEAHKQLIAYTAQLEGRISKLEQYNWLE